MNFRNAAEYIWKRHCAHWNWILMVCFVVLFLAALWLHSIIMFFASAGVAVISLCELPDPVPPFKSIDLLIAKERVWLRKPWNRKKWLQTFGFFVGTCYLFVSCWAGSTMALLLFIGICVNIGCVYSNKAMGVDDL
ncbi:hypothetical protein [Maridesulfovibrio sp.]|uniref:hypothetical protein n=1 Tax=Maridesulfovibrio sp. TaxID=2795000 RepID=UPI002A188CCF|nr:hypothetical protein [Maridesulfovibrio sp.]